MKGLFIMKNSTKRFLCNNYIEFDLDFFNIIQSNLIKGKTVASYKKVCELLNETYKSNMNSKNLQFFIWKMYFDFNISGYSFSIKKLYTKKEVKQNIQNYNNKLQKRNNRINEQNKFKRINVSSSLPFINCLRKLDHKSNIPSFYWNYFGVYMIKNGNTVYIGSTITSFLNRLTLHYNQLSDAGKMLTNEYNYNIEKTRIYLLWYAHKDYLNNYMEINGEKTFIDEDFIRQKEAEFYCEYANMKKSNGDFKYNCINKEIPYYHKSYKNYKQYINKYLDNYINNDYIDESNFSEDFKDFIKQNNFIKKYINPAFKNSKNINIRVSKEQAPLFIKELEKLGMYYNEELNCWTDIKIKKEEKEE